MWPLVCRQGLGNCYFKVVGWLALTSHGDCDAGMQGVVGRLTTLPAKVMVQAPHQILVLGTVRVLKTPGLEAAHPLIRGHSGGQSFRTRSLCSKCDIIPVSKAPGILVLCG